MVTERSRFILDDAKAEGKQITAAQARLEELLGERGWVLAVDGAPWDSAEGGYLGTVNAEDVLDNLLREHPELEGFEDELREHCRAIGELWNGEFQF
jgi:hypothetical protein